MSSFVDDEEAAAARRKAAWQLKAARLKARQEKENAHLETVVENKASQEDDPLARIWLHGEDRSKHNNEQMEYVREYQADYHDFGGMVKVCPRQMSQSGDTDPTNTNEQLPRESDEVTSVNEISSRNSNQAIAPSVASSICEGSDILEELPARHLINTRGRRGRSRLLHSATPAKSVSNEMEQTSTIMPPTELLGDTDFTSNVDVEALRKTYFSHYKTTQNVPIFSHRVNIINSINSYSVVIIQGQTGCGKTTQVPAYILEDAILQRGIPKAPVVWVTQPRRIAAKSIAKRVCEEHDWNLGEVVGYQVGLDKTCGEKTILTFCTAGVLLQKLINEKSLKNYSHIVIDEAHERDADTDLLMMMIRTLMRKEKSFFRLIVMSATIDVTKLKNYFTFKTTFGHNAVTVPSIVRIHDDVKSPWQNDVQVVYIDRLGDNFQLDEKIPQFDLDQPEMMTECLNVAVKIIIEVIPNVDTFNRNTQTVLVFLPGLAEITKLHRLLDATKCALDIIPVHSTLPYADQQRIFFPSERGYRKVILATNIAESSITVRDAGFIIDFCLTKILKKDETTKFPMLKLDWCTKDKLIQRAGRTGRCCPGKVFRLITSYFYKALHDFSEPELLVSPLELSVLKLKAFDMGEVKALLAVVLDPPPLQEIKSAILELKQIGAMTATYQGALCDDDGDLTELGIVIARLPIDVHLSKLIVVASLLDCLDDAIIVAASLSSNRNVVKQLYENPMESYLNKLDWARESQSDMFISLEVYKEYVYFKEVLQKDDRYMEVSCQNKNLDERKLQEITALREDLIFRLEHLNIKILDQPNRIRDRDEDELMLKVAFCAAFYPNYYLNRELDPKAVERDLCGFEPTKTVVLTGFPVGHVPLYRTQVLDQLMAKKIFKDLSITPEDLTFYADQSRALITIDEEPILSEKSNEQPKGFQVGGIVQGKKVLFSLLKSHEQNPFVIREYRQDAAIERMKYYIKARQDVVVPRLVPSLLKLVDDEPNNDHLTVADDDIYNYNMRHKFYTEVLFNHEQDYQDMKKLMDTNHVVDFRSTKPSTSSVTAVPNNVIAVNDVIFGDSRMLRGPESPIQMRFNSVLNKSRGFNVDVCPNSVNSILLDANYRRPRRQMLVAASVSQSQRTNRLIVRDTTLMPDVTGLPTIMSLLFARNYRLIYNEKLQCYSGAIFSLGWDEQGNPLKREYEVELDFDTHVINDDLVLINRARHNISTLIEFIDINNPGAPQAELQQELRQLILSLMKRRRHSLKPIDIDLIDWKSGCFTKEMHNQNLDGELIIKESTTKHRDQETEQTGNEHQAATGASKRRILFLPPLKTNRNVKEIDLIRQLRANIDHLTRVEKNEEPMPVGGVQCLLCGSGVGHVYIFRSKLIEHSFSEEHIRMYEEFEKSEERARLRAQNQN